MKKQIALLIGILLATIIAKSQDIIVKTDGDEIKSKVIKVETDSIKYKLFKNINGPTYAISKTDVFMIKHSNGTKTVFKKDEIKIDEIKKVDYSLMSNQDLETSLNKAVNIEDYKTAEIIQKEIDNRVVLVKKTVKPADTIKKTEKVVRKIESNSDNAITLNPKGFIGGEFLYHGEKTGNVAVKEILKTNSTPLILKDFSEGWTFYGVGRVMVGAGVFVALTSEIIYLGSGKINQSAKSFFFGGIGITAVGSLISYAGRSQMKKSLTKYNSSLNKPTSFKLDFGITPSGVGFTLSL